MSKPFDAIIVGARCAGSPTAMLLARKGFRVLLVDRATFPSDTLSTHVVHPLAVDALRRWGQLDRLVGTGCPPIHTYAFDFGPLSIEGAPGTTESPLAYCPRRTVLDRLLVDAAVEAGAEVRQGVAVDEVVIEDGRVTGVKYTAKSGGNTDRAAVVIGADGRNSVVAEAVRAEKYDERPAVLAPYYAYWSGLPMHGRFETYVRPYRGFAAAETHDGRTVVVCGWPHAEFVANKSDVTGNYLKTLDLVPEFAARIRVAKRESAVAGMPTPNFFRKPYGPGWALVGDAGYLKDPITGQGIQDAFRDAELLTSALEQAFGGARSFDEAMAEYQRTRDGDVRAMYDFTYMLASLEPPPPELEQMLGTIAGDRAAMDRFAMMNAGTISPAELLPADAAAALDLRARSRALAGASSSPR